MSAIIRQPEQAAERRYDLIVIGGGIGGVCVALEAARRGLRPLLVERDDFGGATSWNSLRIVHGGLRYLQHMDLKRMRESIVERHWFCRHFPDLVRPLECLMPLYGKGLRRPALFGIALAMNDFLARHRNDGLPPDRQLGSGRILSARQTQERFALVDTQGLRGAGLWSDALMTNAPRLLIELLKWACACGATALNYVAVKELVVEHGRTRGVVAVDQITGDIYSFHSDRVVNCAGPWSRVVAEQLDRDLTDLIVPSIAFNLLLDHPPVSDMAVAVVPKQPGAGAGPGPEPGVGAGPGAGPGAGARTYFLLPWHGRILAGTYHATWDRGVDRCGPDERQIRDFLDDINQAVPGLSVSRRDVRRIFAGILPALGPGQADMAHHEVIVSHGQRGGPTGLFSICGNKYTTARLIAQKTLGQVFADRGLPAVQPDAQRPESQPPELDLDRPLQLLKSPGHDHGSPMATALRRLVANEAVVHLDDLLFRRTDWAIDPVEALASAQKACDLLGWRDSQRHDELSRVERLLRDSASPTEPDSDAPTTEPIAQRA